VFYCREVLRAMKEVSREGRGSKGEQGIQGKWEISDIVKS
jgi:hypothetical protein